jgi:hypothetical protein
MTQRSGAKRLCAAHLFGSGQYDPAQQTEEEFGSSTSRIPLSSY